MDFSCPEPFPSLEEVVEQIGKLKRNKTPGVDGLKGDIIQCGGDYCFKTIWKLICRIRKDGIWPKDWCDAVFVPIHKKGDAKICENYRTIALVSHVSKVLLKIVGERMQHWLKEVISIEQRGFQRKLGCREQVFNLRNIIQTWKGTNENLYICFIDYSKAFDNVNHEKLWRCLLDFGVSKHLISILVSLYRNQRAVIRVGGKYSEEFRVLKGVRQGGVLSPMLFLLYAELIMSIVFKEFDLMECITLNGKKLNRLMFADDCLFLSKSKKELMAMVSRLKKVSEDFGLLLNVKKTKVMIISNDARESDIKTLDCEGDVIDVVE